MKKFWALVKLLFVQQYKNKQISDKKKKTGTIVAFAVLGLSSLPMIISMAAVSYMLGTSAGLDEGLGSLLMAICQGLVLVFGTMSIISVVFNGQDSDKLLYLPVTSTGLFLAKMTVVYLNEAITTAITVLVLMLPYGIGAGAPVGYFLILPLQILLVPILPLFVGCLVCMPFSLLVARIKNNGMLKTILQTTLFVGVMTVYLVLVSKFTNLQSSTESGNLFEVVAQIVDGLKAAGHKLDFLHANYMLIVAMCSTSFGSWSLAFVTSIAEYAAMVGLLALTSLPFYKWIVFASMETGASKHGGDISVKQQGVIPQLIFTDLKRVMRHNQMGFQALASIIVMPLLIVVFYITLGMGDNSMVAAYRHDPLYQAVAPLAILGYMSMLGITSNTLGLYPISRENNSLYLLKSLPVSFEKILLAKVILATSVMFVSDLLTSILACLTFGLHWYYSIPMLIVMALLGFGGMCISTLLDLRSPKLGWTNFNQSLKNAKNSWLAMLIGLAASLAISIVALAFILWFVFTLQWYAVLLMWIAIAIISAVFAILSYKAMNKRAAKYFAAIE